MADLIRKGFNKDPSLRPGPEELLQHHAFQILGMFLIAIRQGGGGGDILFLPCSSNTKVSVHNHSYIRENFPCED